MIVGALVSSGGGLVAGTLGAWTNQWSMSTPPVLRPGAGTWGTLDVWGGAVTGMYPILPHVSQCIHLTQSLRVV